MRIFVLYAHPVEDSFNAAVHTAAVETLKAAGHEADDCDLYAEGFDPVLTRAERQGYHDTSTNRGPVADHVDRLLRADALVLIYPVWNMGFPAILKGYFDRVFLPGVSFDLTDGKVSPTLTNIKRLTAISTYGGARWMVWLAGDPCRKVITRVFNRTIAPGARVDFLAHYDMNRSTDATRSAFLGQVQAILRKY